jgi:putative ABC transport system ATP-binding protein
VRLEIAGPEKSSLTVADLIGHFSTKTDRMLLGT